MDKKNILWLYSQLPDLVDKNIITKEGSENIKRYYGTSFVDKKNEIIITLFAILGSIFVGLGIISMVAYNWDQFSRPVKTSLSFLPLLLGQGLCLFTILKKYSSDGWREGSSIFLMAGIGASISLISQTYHSSGNFSDFLIVWLLLAMPLIYIMSSGSVAFLYLFGITSWSGMTNQPTSSLFWVLILFLIPEIIGSFKDDKYSSRSLLLAWAIPISILVNIIISFEYSNSGLWIVILSSYFSLLYTSGQLWFNNNNSFFMKPLQVMGISGIIILSFTLTYIGSWTESLSSNRVDTYSNLPMNIMVFCLPIIALYTMYKLIKNNKNYDVMIGSIALISIFCSFVLKNNLSFISPIIFNLYILTVGIVTIVSGTKDNSLVKLNGGMVIISLLIMLRFFDIDMSFLFRGIVFILIGVAFFVSNYMMTNRKQEINNEK